MCTFVDAGLDSVSPWRDGSISMQTFPCPVSGWFCELQGPVIAPELLSEVFARFVQDLVRYGGLEGAYAGTIHPLWLSVGACGHPGFEEKSYQVTSPWLCPHQSWNFILEFILDFDKNDSNLQCRQ